jgi:hypothetical protein
MEQRSENDEQSRRCVSFRKGRQPDMQTLIAMAIRQTRFATHDEQRQMKAAAGKIANGGGGKRAAVSTRRHVVEERKQTHTNALHQKKTVRPLDNVDAAISSIKQISIGSKLRLLPSKSLILI